ncbi:MAG: sugar phosphate nucleotidyltransferase [Propionibacteriaceae bacterium]|nr:sugar phosphate nucleotidyltransferase [Propionibacteriaceae bacterium]
MDYVAIMAGGSGTRLWPLSRRTRPKQFLPLFNGTSPLQLAYARARTLVPSERILVCAGADHYDIITQQLPDLLPDNLLLEPVGRDSLAAISWLTGAIHRRDREAVVAVLSADHMMTPEESFTQSLGSAMLMASQDRQALVTCGVVPTHPHTGYGYLRLGALHDSSLGYLVDEYLEKPSLEQAQLCLAQGGWWWNSGIFVFAAETFLTQLTALQPQMADAVTSILDDPSAIAEVYPHVPQISVDYAIMEPLSQGLGTAHIVVHSLGAQWSDVGSYDAVAHALVDAGTAHVDSQHNILKGEVVALDSRDNIVLNRGPDGQLIAVLGIEDMIVINDEDVTLVCSRQHAARIKELRKLVEESGGDV